MVPDGCTGYRDEQGHLAHDGDTCPVHELGPEAILRAYINRDREVVVALTEKMPEETRAEYLAVHDQALAALKALAAGQPPEVIVRLSGSDVVGIEVDGYARVSVHQYHVDHQGDDGELSSDEHGVFEIAEAASGTAPTLRAGSSPGRAAEHRGVRAWATLEDNPEHANHLVVRCFLDPPPAGSNLSSTPIRPSASPTGTVSERDSVTERVNQIIRDESRRAHLAEGPVVRCHKCGCELATVDGYSGMADGRRVYFCESCNLEDDEPTPHDEWPVHQPEADDAPISGRHWYAGCEPGGDQDLETGRYGGTGPRVNPATGTCEGCGATACRECGRENCPDHLKEETC